MSSSRSHELRKTNTNNNAILLFILFVVLVTMLMLNRAIVQYSDSLIYAYYAKTGSLLFHPHHLLYPAASRIFYLATNQLDFCCGLCGMQLHSAIWGALAVVGFLVIIRRLTHSQFVASIAAAFLLFSPGFWTWSTQVEAYIPSLGAQILFSAILLCRTGEKLSKAQYFWLSSLLAISITYHQAAVLFVIPVFIYMLASQKFDGILSFIRLSIYSGILTLFLYVLAFCYAHSDCTVNGFIRWIFQYSSSGHDWGRVANFGLLGLSRLYDSQISNLLLLPSYMGLPNSSIYAAVSMFLFFVVAWNIVQTVRRKEYFSVRLFFLAWLLTQSMFLLWWLPGLRQFIISNTVSLIALAALMWLDLLKHCDGQLYRRPALILATISMLFYSYFNYASIIRPQHQSPDWAYRAAERINPRLPNKCLLVDDWGVGLNMQFYFDWRYLDADALLLDFYHAGQRGTKNLDAEKCILINSKFLSPEYSVAKGLNGYDNPTDWTIFYSSILGIEWVDDSPFYYRYRVDSVDTGKDGIYYQINQKSKIRYSKAGDSFAEVYNRFLKKH